MTVRRRPNVVLAALLAALGSEIAGCGASGNERAREYMPDMARGPAYKAFAPNTATRTGLLRLIAAPASAALVAVAVIRHHLPIWFDYRTSCIDACLVLF